MTIDHSLKPRKRPTQQRSIAMVNAILDASTRILKERGYPGMSTNAVAELAGVSIGSLYQYFPSKEALLIALRDRHAEEMGEAISTILATPDRIGLKSSIARLVHAAIAAHEVEPELHRVLEKEIPFFREDSDRVGKEVHHHIKQLLVRHRDEVRQPNLDLASWVTIRMTESLVHAAVLESPPAFNKNDLEVAVESAIYAFLTLDAHPIRSNTI